MPFKTFAAEVLTASDVNTFLIRQAVITCTSTTRPASPTEGMLIYETDTDDYRFYTGSAWKEFLLTDTQTWTPQFIARDVTSPNALSTTFATGNGTWTGGYLKIGSFVYFWGTHTFGTGWVYPLATELVMVSKPFAVTTGGTGGGNSQSAFATFQDTSAGRAWLLPLQNSSFPVSGGQEYFLRQGGWDPFSTGVFSVNAASPLPATPDTGDFFFFNGWIRTAGIA